MKKTGCEKCSDLRQFVQIRTPGEMAKAVRVIRANMQDAIIKDITQPDHTASAEFSDLSETGPWPDYVEHYFECTHCGARFRFAVETYHGAGGAWDGKVECY